MNELQKTTQENEILKILLSNLLDCGTDDIDILTDMNFDYNSVIFDLKTNESALTLENITRETYYRIILEVQEKHEIEFNLNDYFDLYFNYYDTYFNLNYDELNNKLKNANLLQLIINDIEDYLNYDLTY